MSPHGDTPALPLRKFADTLAAPSWIVFQLLEACNLRCRMCYEWGETGAYHALGEPAMLDLDLVLRTVQECLPRRPAFEFFGGEPMMYPGLWEVTRAIRAGGCTLAFPTNGTLLEAHAEQLVAEGPTRLWVSLDGPAAVNDRQRGRGVYQRVMRGIAALARAKAARGSRWPEIGINCVVTPGNCDTIDGWLLQEVDLSQLACLSLELQSFATRGEAARYAADLRAHFGVAATPCANAYVRDPAIFADIDPADLAARLSRVAAACTARGIEFHSQPRTLTADNLAAYLRADWPRMADHRTRCGVPWVTAEISARGEVSTCHSFNDLSLGNLHEQGLLEIWRGERARKLREHLRQQLFSICTACCRYYT